jgi:hypothetical protein
MPIGVLERTGVATPECIVRRIGDHRARFFDLCHDRIYFCFARDIVAERALSRASRAKRNFGFMGERCAEPNGELQAMLKIKEEATAPCSNSVPMMPFVGRPSLSR